MRSCVIVAVLLLAVATGPALAAGDAQAGRQLAQQWCTGCHVIDSSTQGADTAPSFPSIASRSAHDHGWVRAWLMAPHPPMPNLSLSRQQIDDVVAYLDTLAPR
jgi:mono/diheme cytochrome c family protein